MQTTAVHSGCSSQTLVVSAKKLPTGVWPLIHNSLSQNFQTRFECDTSNIRQHWSYFNINIRLNKSVMRNSVGEWVRVR
jgi:hypothetical protein